MAVARGSECSVLRAPTPLPVFGVPPPVTAGRITAIRISASPALGHEPHPPRGHQPDATGARPGVGTGGDPYALSRRRTPLGLPTTAPVVWLAHVQIAHGTRSVTGGIGDGATEPACRRGKLRGSGVPGAATVMSLGAPRTLGLANHSDVVLGPRRCVRSESGPT
jgi:hypothetical protein